MLASPLPGPLWANMMLSTKQVLSIAEMGDRLATIDMGRKEGAAVPLSGARSHI